MTPFNQSQNAANSNTPQTNVQKFRRKPKPPRRRRSRLEAPIGDETKAAVLQKADAAVLIDLRERYCRLISQYESTPAVLHATADVLVAMVNKLRGEADALENDHRGPD